LSLVFIFKSYQLEKLALNSHQHSAALRRNSQNPELISAQQRGLVKIVLCGITNFYSVSNNGLTFKIKLGEVCATGVELLP
jgi:hypothetical protein